MSRFSSEKMTDFIFTVISPQYFFLLSALLFAQGVSAQEISENSLQSCPSNEVYATTLLQAVEENEIKFEERTYSLEPGSINNCSGYVGMIMKSSLLVPVERNVWGEKYPTDLSEFPHSNAQAQFSWIERQSVFDHSVTDWNTAPTIIAQAVTGSFIFIENPPERVSHRGYGGITHVGIVYNENNSIEIINFAQTHESGPERESLQEFLDRYSYGDLQATIHLFSYNQENCR